jgi:hypothetical protein
MRAQVAVLSIEDQWDKTITHSNVSDTMSLMRAQVEALSIEDQWDKTITDSNVSDTFCIDACAGESALH